MVERHALGRHAEALAANRRWKPMATLHRPIARWPSSSSACVTMPTGFVKSTTQASLAPRRGGRLGDVEHHRYRAQSLGEAARPGRLLADAAELERQRLVDEPGRLAADAQLDDDEARAVDGAHRDPR